MTSSRLVLSALLALVVFPALAGLDVPPAAVDTSTFAAKTDLPVAGTNLPPATAIDSATGTGVAYARADHTHATSVQRMRFQVSPSGQPVRWTFGKPYDAGIVPVVVCTAENTQTATRPFVVNTVSVPTNTYVDLIVFQAAQPTVSLLGASVTLFGAASNGTLVNCQAAKPTQ